MEGFCSSAFGSIALLGAGSPANLEAVNSGPHCGRKWYVLIGHDNQETLAGIHVCLKLIVLGMYAGTTAQKEQKLGGEMGVVARFCNIDLTLISGHDLRHDLGDL